jgi:hypothetical protein
MGSECPVILTMKFIYYLLQIKVLLIYRPENPVLWVHGSGIAQSTGCKRIVVSTPYYLRMKEDPPKH